MPLKRKAAFIQPRVTTPAHVTAAAYLHEEPWKHYQAVNVTRGGVVAECRGKQSRQLVVIHRVYELKMRGFETWARICHGNISKLLALYRADSGCYVVYEFVDLQLRDIFPLHHGEVAAAMTQIMSAVHALLRERFVFRIQDIRVSCYGVVKLVPDWNQEPSEDDQILNANTAYIAADLLAAMDEMGACLQGWTSHAIRFRAILESGWLPELQHPFLLSRTESTMLVGPTTFAMRKALQAAQAVQTAHRAHAAYITQHPIFPCELQAGAG